MFCICEHFCSVCKLYKDVMNGSLAMRPVSANHMLMLTYWGHCVEEIWYLLSGNNCCRSLHFNTIFYNLHVMITACPKRQKCKLSFLSLSKQQVAFFHYVLNQTCVNFIYVLHNLTYWKFYKFVLVSVTLSHFQSHMRVWKKQKQQKLLPH